MIERFAGWAGRRAAPWSLGAAALLLTLPALAVGLQFDDYPLLRTLRANDLAAGLARAFVFMDGDPVHAQAQMETGFFPWWTLPAGQVAFMRPVSALTHRLDVQLWPDQPIWMHLHSLLWFGLAVAVTAWLFRELLPAPAAGLAALLYAVDDAHGYAAGWLSNRNILLAVVFGALALLAHHRWRGRGQARGRWLGPLAFGLALLSAEAGLAVFGYLLAYTLHRDPAPRPWRALLPYLGIAGLWLLAYRWGGYGVWGTSYVDPAREPLSFLSAAVERIPILLVGQFALPPAEFYPFVSAALLRAVWWLAGAGLLAALIRAWRARPAGRFWLTGLGLSVILASASLPANRLLFFAGWGALGWLAPVVSAAPARFWKRAALGLHLVLAPLLLPLTAYSPRLFGGLEPALLAAPLTPTAESVLVVSAPSAFHAQYLGLIRTAYGLSAPARVRYLGAGLAALTLTRPDAVTLSAEPAGGYLTGFDEVFRGAGHPLAIGDVIALSDVRIEIITLTADARPARAAFHFAAPLESSRYQWLAWRAGRFEAFAPPPVGGTLTVPIPSDLIH